MAHQPLQTELVWATPPATSSGLAISKSVRDLPGVCTVPGDPLQASSASLRSAAYAADRAAVVFAPTSAVRLGSILQAAMAKGAATDSAGAGLAGTHVSAPAETLNTESDTEAGAVEFVKAKTSQLHTEATSPGAFEAAAAATDTGTEVLEFADAEAESLDVPAANQTVGPVPVSIPEPHPVMNVPFAVGASAGNTVQAVIAHTITEAGIGRNWQELAGSLLMTLPCC